LQIQVLHKNPCRVTARKSLPRYGKKIPAALRQENPCRVTAGIGEFSASQPQHRNGFDTVSLRTMPIPRGHFCTGLAGRSSDFKLHVTFHLPRQTSSGTNRNVAPLLQRRVRAGLSPASLFTGPMAFHARPTPAAACIHLIYRSKQNRIPVEVYHRNPEIATFLKLSFYQI